MPNIYVTDTTRKKLNYLTRIERRSLSLQIDFLCDARLKQLDIQKQDNPLNNANIQKSQSATG